MPYAAIPLVDEYTQISRRITSQITQRFIYEMGLPRDIKIRYRGESTQLHLWNSDTRTFKNAIENVDGTQFGHGDILDVELKEEISDEGYNRINTFWNQEVPPYWEMPQEGVSISGQYANRQIEINYTYHSSTMETAHWFRNQILNYFGQNRNVMVVTVDYNIIPAQYIWDIMKDVYRCVESNEGTGLSYPDWLKAYTKDNMLTQLSNLTQTGHILAFKEAQENLFLVFNDTTIPDKDKRDSNPGYTMQFTLKFQMEKPYECVVKYPVVIHNTMMEDKFIHPPEDLSHGMKSHVTYGRMTGALRYNHWLNDTPTNYNYTNLSGIYVPLGDDWCNHQLLRYYKPILTAITPLSEPNQTIGKMCIGFIEAYDEQLYLSRHLKRFLKREYRYLHRDRETLLLVQGYRNNDKLMVSVDEDGYIYTESTYSLKDTIRIVIAYPTLFSNHSSDFFMRLSWYPRLVEDIYMQYQIGQRLLTVGEIVHACCVEHRSSHGSTPLPQYLHKYALQRYWKQFPYQRFGAWHKVISDVMFAIASPKSYAHLTDKLLMLVGDSIYQTNNPEERYQIIINAESDFYNWAREQDKSRNDLEFDTYFYGVIDRYRLTKELAEMRTDALYTSALPDYRIPLMRTHQIAYINTGGNYERR